MKSLPYTIKIIKESILVILITTFLSMISGTVLSASEETLLSLPFIILILPAVNDLIGDISTVSVSRISSHLYLGSLPVQMKPTSRLWKDLIGLGVTLLLSVVTLLISGTILAYYTHISINKIIILAGIILFSVILLFLTLFFGLFAASIILFKHGKDPNNFLVAISTSLADFLSPLFLLALIKLFIH